MEVGVRLIGILLRILNFLLAPLFWYHNRHKRRLPPPPQPLLLKSAVELASDVRNGQISSEKLVSIYIDRVKEVNPYINAVVDERYRAAIEDAKEVDRQIAEARKNGTLDELVKDKPLLGVPFSVKESCSLAGLSNSVGCLENAGRRATADGEVVRLVRAAGAIPLLVSNTPELCLGWETTNLLRGTTNNPYCLNRTPGGSSGGEGYGKGAGSRILTIHEAQGLTYANVVIVRTTTTRQELHNSIPHAVVAISRHTISCKYYADDGNDAIGRFIRETEAAGRGMGALLACGASAFSVASDVAGSIRVPAAFCGVFGHKPTPGIISISGHIPTLNDELFPRFLAVGPMARRAVDLPVLLEVMAGDNKHMFRLDEPVDLSKVKVHFMTEAGSSLALIRVNHSIRDMIYNCAEYLQKECGCQISGEKFPDLEDSVELSVSVFFSMKDIPNMLQDPADPKRDRSLFLELVKSLFHGGTRSLQALGFTLIHKSQLFIPKSRRKFYKEKADKLREQFTRTLGDTGVLLYPVCPGPAHRHAQVFVRASGVLYTMVFNILGLPATAVPLGLHRGLPIGIQVVAAPNQDRLCLAVAKQLEKGFGGWRPPQ